LKKYFSQIDAYNVSFLAREDIDFSEIHKLSDYCQQIKPDLLIHAAVSLDDFQNNISMYLSLEQCSAHCGKVIMIGSGAEYSHQRYKPLMQENYYNPNEPPINNNTYHLSKHIISRLHSASALSNIYNFRVFGLYGPYEDYTRRLISNNIFKYLVSGEMSASTNHAFDYLYVDDLINAILHFANSPTTPKFNTYNVCSGRSDRFFDILSEVVISLGGTPSVIKMESTEPTSYIYSGNCSRFEHEFNYQIQRTNYSKSATLLKSWISSEILPVN